MFRWLALIALTAGCAPARNAENADDWYSEGVIMDVEEPVAFTDQPYSFPVVGDGVGRLKAIPRGNFTTYFEDGSDLPDNDCDWSTASELPTEVEGVVTIHPRFYFKTDGCNRDDEKYYGSYFIEDSTGGIFILGDSKVAHFDMGDRVRLKIRAIRTSYDLPMVISHDVLEVTRGPEPIYYQVPERPWPLPTDAPYNGTGDSPSADDIADIGQVHRVEGTVVSETDTFGEFVVENDQGERYVVGLDVELNRRKVNYPIGTRITATGPVMYSYDVFKIVIMRVGQIEVLD